MLDFTTKYSSLNANRKKKNPYVKNEQRIQKNYMFSPLESEAYNQLILQLFY